LLHVWLNKGDDIRKDLWLSETSARNGTNKILSLEEKKIKIVIPRESYDGLVILLRGLGKKPSFRWHAPFLRRKRGNLLVRLFVYPDTITPKYGSFDTLSTENMALEGWVYRKFDEVIGKLDQSSLPPRPIQASTISDLFNDGGWMSIFNALVDHLGLDRSHIDLTISTSISNPGSCQRWTAIRENKLFYSHSITINEQFLDNPFSIAAIMAHELCHIVYYLKIDETPKSAGYVIKSEEATLEEERTIDLLVFMFKMGEFQLRVARDQRLTLGYFNQEVFERIHVIVSKKMNSF
jgi:hypothetical protein